SDTTYRLYDWDRVDDAGQSRELHLEKGAESVRYERFGPVKPDRSTVSGPSFSLKKLTTGDLIPSGLLRVFIADSGNLKLKFTGGEEDLTWGDTIVAEESDGDIEIISGTALLASEA
ncbi:hypothetical protein KAI87_16160, partial [Myxococcota bacterium]|nr:hypothetical protein [Myxococcota bacterium]